MDQPKNDIVRDSAILRFELTFEVAWKLIQASGREEGLDIKSPRQAFQEAFSLGWIDDEEIWFEIIKARNMATHVYRQKLAEELYSRLDSFYQAFERLQKSVHDRWPNSHPLQKTEANSSSSVPLNNSLQCSRYILYEQAPDRFNPTPAYF